MIKYSPMPKKTSYIFYIFIAITISLVFTGYVTFGKTEVNGAPPYGEALSDVPETVEPADIWANWVRPEGPAKVGLQVGHWKNEELPKELEKLIGSTGASGGGKSEWEVNYAIAIETQKLLEAEGVEVDIIPATVPEDYWADVFIAIHADGSLDTSVSGYKVAGPWRSFRNSSNELVEYLDQSYKEATGLPQDPNISRNMRGYYAFSWWRYDHAIHPMTSAAIVETGFLTNYSDRQMLINSPAISANGIAKGTIEFLKSEGLL